MPEGTIESDAEARKQKSARTVLDTYGAVTGKSVTAFSQAFDSNNTGQAYRKDTSEPVNITGIDRMENGRLLLMTDSGQTVSADNVSYGSYGEARVYRAISAMDVDTETAKAIYGMLGDTELSAREFADAIQTAYLRGFTGVDFDRLNPSGAAGKLTQQQRRTLWEAGRKARGLEDLQQMAKLGRGSHGKADSGLTIAESARNIGKLNDAQKAGLSLAKALANAGFSIEVYASTDAERAEGAPNGSFDPESGRIRVDLNAGDEGQGVTAYALSHEMTHFAKEFSPEKYQTFVDILVEAVGKDGISYENMLEQKTAALGQMEQYREYSEKKLAELAQDEVVAEMCETMLTDTDAAAMVSQRLYDEDRGLG